MNQRKLWMSRLAKTKTLPNFWMTEEFIKFKGLQWECRRLLCGWTEEGEWYFPPWSCESNEWCNRIPHFAGFPWTNQELYGPVLSLLDYQYVYDPFNFQDISGGRWKVWRKNIRKWPRRHTGKTLQYRFLERNELQQEIEDLILKWSDGKTLHDPDVLVRFLLFGEFRWGLFLGQELVGVNVGDVNWKYTVYRYCLTNGDGFLSEYMRHLFYTSEYVLGNRREGKLVNDGGDLGNPGLAQFKRRLNPVYIQEIYTRNAS